MNNLQKGYAINRVTKIKNEKLKLIVDQYTDVNNVFVFTAEVEDKVKATKIKLETAKLEKSFNKVCDEIMLGDEKHAMELIAKFGQSKIKVKENGYD